MRAGGSLLLLLSGCGGQPAVPPGGIISNNPCIDAVLERIAAPGQVAAVSIYSHDAQSASASLPWARRFPAIGTSAEEVIAARPRLLLTGNLATGGTNAALRRAGVTFQSFGVPANIAESKAQIAAIAKAIGREDQGSRLAAEIDKAAGFRPSSAPTRSAIIWQNGGFVAGRGTLQDEMLARAGFTNAAALYGLNQWSILPAETLIRNPPDVIFMPIGVKGAEAERTLALRRRLLTRAAPHTRIVHFPDRLAFCGGPAIIDAMDRMREATG